MSLYIFDKDGTLVKKVPVMGKVIRRTPMKPEEQELEPGVYEKLQELRKEGHALAIATNQDLVARGRISREQAELMVEDCIIKVGGVNAWRYCGCSPHAPKRLNGRENPYAQDDECRKPHPGMIISLMAQLEYPAEDTIMIGDSSKDRKAAKNAGVRFISAKKFFKSKDRDS